MKKNSFEVHLAKLKKLQEKYAMSVSSLESQRDHILSRLEEMNQLYARTTDAIDALEGRPTMAAQLAKALEEQKKPSPVSTYGDKLVENVVPPEVLTLPPAEPGMHWAKNELGEDVLVPDTIPAPRKVEGVGIFTLPPITEEEGFLDNPEAFIVP